MWERSRETLKEVGSERKGRAGYKGSIIDKLLLWATAAGALETVKSMCFGVTAPEGWKEHGYLPSDSSQPLVEGFWNTSQVLLA